MLLIFIYLSFYYLLYIYLFIYLYIHLFIYLSYIYISFYLSVHLLGLVDDPDLTARGGARGEPPERREDLLQHLPRLEEHDQPDHGQGHTQPGVYV